MTHAKTVLAAGTRFSGQLVAEGDVQIEGRFEGGPLRVGGRLTVAAQGHVEATQADVGEADVLGLFRGTLKARDVVRLHASGRVLGDIFSPRVVFVSDADATASQPAAAPPPPVTAPAASPPPSAPTRSPVESPTPQPPPSPVLSPAAPASPAAPPVARAPRRTPPSTPQPAQPAPAAAVAPRAATPAPASPAPAAPTPRTIPALPSLGQRSMQRLPSRES